MDLPNYSMTNPPDPITRLNAALEGRYRIEREIDEGGMARPGLMTPGSTAAKPQGLRVAKPAGAMR